MGRNFLDPDIFEAPRIRPKQWPGFRNSDPIQDVSEKKLVDPKFILFSKNRILVHFFTFYLSFL